MVVGYETKINRTKINQTKYNQTKINRGRNPTNCSIRSRDLYLGTEGVVSMAQNTTDGFISHINYSQHEKRFVFSTILSLQKQLMRSWIS